MICGCCGEPKVVGHSSVCSHASQTCSRCQRTAKLVAALAVVGCDLRSDSKLSRLYITGRTEKTATEVARRMAEVRRGLGAGRPLWHAEGGKGGECRPPALCASCAGSMPPGCPPSAFARVQL
jgi:hypothetical protein